MSKYETWYESLPESTKIYLKSQPIWHDSDMWRAGMFGLVVGFILGVIL
jgi:hypothetical protein